MPEPTLTAQQKRALAAALLACPSMADRVRRDAVIGELPASIRDNIARNDAGLLDVTNTIIAALNYPRGLDNLIEIVRLFEGSSLAMTEVERVLVEFAPAGTVATRRTNAAGPAGDRWVLESPVVMEFVRVPAGQFLMGSDPELDIDAEDREQPQHCVHLPEFYIGKYPVTVAQYTVFARATRRAIPNEQGGTDSPVVNVTWFDAVLVGR